MREMTAEDFLAYIGQVVCYRDKGRARLNRAKGLYRDYVKAYQETSLARLVTIAAISRSTYPAIKHAAMDRDAGLPMIHVAELEQTP